MLFKGLLVLLALAAALSKLRPLLPRQHLKPHVHSQPAGPLHPPAAPAGTPSVPSLDKLPGPGDDPFTCPVCGWDPCLANCRMRLLAREVKELRQMFDAEDDE